jgi:hypothetical protein
MARNITLTLGAGLGADLGPNFNLTANVGSVTPSTATKSELTAGKSVSVDDAATGVTITSTGTCTNGITQTIPCALTTTTTSTSTSTTTEPPTTTTTTTAGATVDIAITNSSLDVPIGSMAINSVNVDWIGSGPDFVLSAGDNGSFTSTQTGTQDVVIGYGGHIPGQRITFYDSNNFATCQTLNGSVGTFTITGATITAGTSISVLVEDGICP